MNKLAMSVLSASLMAAAGNVQAQRTLSDFFPTGQSAVADYDYADLQHAADADDFDGFELLGSKVVRPNVALIGRLGRISGSVKSGSTNRAAGDLSVGADGVSTTYEVGARYFRQFDRLPDSDLNLSASLVNQNHKLDGEAAGSSVSISDSETFLQLGSQVRRLFGQPLAGGRAVLSEAYVGALAALSDEGSLAGQAGVVVDFSARVSGKAEVLLDDGANVRLGVRMALGQVSSSQLFGKAKPVEEATAPETAALRQGPSDDEVMRAVEEFEIDDFGLSAEELSDIEEAFGVDQGL